MKQSESSMPHRRPFLDKLRMDLQTALENDPAARGVFAPFEVVLTYPGFHAILIHRINHELYKLGIPFLPRVIQTLNRFVTGVDVHPAAKIGGGLFIDHAHGTVIGETAEVGEHVTLFHQVTLGGTGKQRGKRHPTLKSGVVVGTGAKILGAITIGNNVYVGANSVVLTDVPDDCTVVGIPGRIVRQAGKAIGPSQALDHVHMPDPIRDRLLDLEARIVELQAHFEELEQQAAPGVTGPVE